eukprot:UN06866
MFTPTKSVLGSVLQAGPSTKRKTMSVSRHHAMVLQQVMVMSNH